MTSLTGLSAQGLEQLRRLPAWSEASIAVPPTDYDGAVDILRRAGVVLLRGAIGTGIVAEACARARDSYERLPGLMRDHPGTTRVLGEQDLLAPGLTPHFPELLQLVGRMIEHGVLRPILERYFGAPIVPVADEMRFRRHRPSVVRTHVPLHQDIMFTGTDRSLVNCWVPLTPCGREAPGLEVAATHMAGRFVHHGKSPPGAYPMDHVPDQMLAGFPVPMFRIAPEFEAGDVLLFDGWCLHRTTDLPGMTKERLSVEARYSFEGSLGPAIDKLRPSPSLG